jgi:hypothetical protein
MTLRVQALSMQQVKAAALGFVVRATQVEAAAVQVQVTWLWESLYQTVCCNGVASPSVVNATSQSSGIGICCQVIWELICVVVECCRVGDVFFPSYKFGSKFWSHTRRNRVLYYFFGHINLYPNIADRRRMLELVAYSSPAVVSSMMAVELKFSLNRGRQLFLQEKLTIFLTPQLPPAHAVVVAVAVAVVS